MREAVVAVAAAMVAAAGIFLSLVKVMGTLAAEN